MYFDIRINNPENILSCFSEQKYYAVKEKDFVTENVYATNDFEDFCDIERLHRTTIDVYNMDFSKRHPFTDYDNNQWKFVLSCINVEPDRFIPFDSETAHRFFTNPFVDDYGLKIRHKYMNDIDDDGVEFEFVASDYHFGLIFDTPSGRRKIGFQSLFNTYKLKWNNRWIPFGADKHSFDKNNKYLL